MTEAESDDLNAWLAEKSWRGYSSGLARKRREDAARRVQDAAARRRLKTRRIMSAQLIGGGLSARELTLAYRYRYNILQWIRAGRLAWSAEQRENHAAGINRLLTIAEGVLDAAAWLAVGHVTQDRLWSHILDWAVLPPELEAILGPKKLR